MPDIPDKFLKPYNEDMERYLEKLVEDSDKKLAKYLLKLIVLAFVVV